MQKTEYKSEQGCMAEKITWFYNPAGEYWMRESLKREEDGRETEVRLIKVTVKSGRLRARRRAGRMPK